MYEIVPLKLAHLAELPIPDGLDHRAYFTRGSAAYCVLNERVPVFAGGVVNMLWGRGEAWILPTDFLRSHKKCCFYIMREFIPHIAKEYGFRRIQATCLEGISASLFNHLGFEYEGRLSSFGPQGETCDLYSRVFEVTP